MDLLQPTVFKTVSFGRFLPVATGSYGAPDARRDWQKSA